MRTVNATVIKLPTELSVHIELASSSNHDVFSFFPYYKFVTDALEPEDPFLKEYTVSRIINRRTREIIFGNIAVLTNLMSNDAYDRLNHVGNVPLGFYRMSRIHAQIFDEFIFTNMARIKIWSYVYRPIEIVFRLFYKIIKQLMVFLRIVRSFRYVRHIDTSTKYLIFRTSKISLAIRDCFDRYVKDLGSGEFQFFYFPTTVNEARNELASIFSHIKICMNSLCKVSKEFKGLINYNKTTNLVTLIQLDEDIVLLLEYTYRLFKRFIILQYNASYLISKFSNYTVFSSCPANVFELIPSKVNMSIIAQINYHMRRNFNNLEHIQYINMLAVNDLTFYSAVNQAIIQRRVFEPIMRFKGLVDMLEYRNFESLKSTIFDQLMYVSNYSKFIDDNEKAAIHQHFRCISVVELDILTQIRDALEIRLQEIQDDNLKIFIKFLHNSMHVNLILPMINNNTVYSMVKLCKKIIYFMDYNKTRGKEYNEFNEYSQKYKHFHKSITFDCMLYYSQKLEDIFPDDLIGYDNEENFRDFNAFLNSDTAINFSRNQVTLNNTEYVNVLQHIFPKPEKQTKTIELFYFARYPWLQARHLANYFLHPILKSMKFDELNKPCSVHRIAQIRFQTYMHDAESSRNFAIMQSFENEPCEANPQLQPSDIKILNNELHRESLRVSKVKYENFDLGDY